MTRIVLTALAVALVVTPAFADDQQFNLVCKGTKTLLRGPAEEIPGSAEPYSVTLSLDMAQAQFCVTPCKIVEALDEITPDHIKKTSTITGPLIQTYELTQIERGNGRLLWVSIIMMPNRPFDGWQVDADCTKAAFSGFPSSSF